MKSIFQNAPATLLLAGCVAFFLDGGRVMASAPFAPVYEGANSLRGKATRCAVTDKPWKSSYNGKRVKMSIKRGYIGS